MKYKKIFFKECDEQSHFFCRQSKKDIPCNEISKIVVNGLMHQLDYNQLLKDCLKQKPEAQKKLYENFAPSMLGDCFIYTKSIDEAEEVLQEGLLPLKTILFIKKISKIVIKNR